MHKLLDKYIEWLVAIAVVYITTLSMFRALLGTFELVSAVRLVSYSIVPLLGLIFVYQKRHYGIKIYDKSYYCFYLIYCLYILLYITVFRRYPLEDMLAVPTSVVVYFYDFAVSIVYLICAPTIYHHFCLKKFMFLSLIVCTIPSVLFVHFVGVDLIQAGISEDDEEYVPTLTITYSNVPMFVLAVMNFKNLHKRAFLSKVIAMAIIIAVIYVFFAYAKRGPMLWSVVSIGLCFLIRTHHLKRSIALMSLAVIFLWINVDPILSAISEVYPRTGRQLEKSIKEGNTSARMDFSDPKHSTYLIGIENFSRSPIWGYYFRLVTDFQHFKGAYAHNIFIEVLMTMGLLGFMPFMLLMFRAFLKSRNVFTKTYTVKQMSFFILFLCVFLQLQTSASIVFRHNFWLFFYMLCCIDVIDKIKEKIPVRYSQTRSLSLKQTT